MFERNLNFKIKASKQSLIFIEDIATKTGSLFGENARGIGKKIDEMTKDITIEQDILSYNHERY